MYYSELLDVARKTGAKEAIEKLDKYLAFLPNRSQNIITSSNIASMLELDYNVVDVILKYIYDLGIFEKVYIVICPHCGREILTSSKKNLMEDIKNQDYCIRCRNDIKIDLEDIYVGYKVIKQPKLEEKHMIEETEKLLGKTKESTDQLDNLEKLFDKHKENPHDFFYDPSEADIESLKKSFNELDYNYKNPTSQGKALEGLILKLFNICKGITATTEIRTPTNQIDCTARNDYAIRLTVYDELGSIVQVECKNEPKKKPDNTYYHKLHGIIETSKSDNEQAVGVLVSRREITRPCNDLAKQYFLKDNIIIINIYDYDLDRIINKRENFLNVLQEKIQQVKKNISIPPEKHKLYRKS